MKKEIYAIINITKKKNICIYKIYPSEDAAIS